MHKISGSLLSSRCMTNYMWKTCSFLYDYFTETMKVVENMILKKKAYGEKLAQSDFGKACCIITLYFAKLSLYKTIHF